MDANAQGTQDGSRDDTRTTEPRQTSYTGFREGDWDVMLAGSGNNDKRWTSGAGSLAASVGYLLTDELEVSVRQSLLMADSPGSESVAIGASAVAIDYHVTMGGVYPFVGANFGRVYGDTIDDTWTAAPEAGVKVFLQRDAYLLVMAEYELGFDDAEEIDDGWKDGTFVYKVGFGLRF